MRKLTTDEILMVAGGLTDQGGDNNGGDVVVVGPSGGGLGMGDVTNPGYSGGGGSGGGSGTGTGIDGSHGYDPYAHTVLHRTASGHNYFINGDLHLSDDQLKAIDKIIDTGISLGVRDGDINIAVRQAFYESSLGKLVNNPGNSDVQGLYQWDSKTWSDHHSDLNRASDTDQIKAMFQDIDRLSNKMNNMGASPTSSNGHVLSYEEYIEVNHHLGENNTYASSPKYDSPIVADYNDKTNNLAFDVAW